MIAATRLTGLIAYCRLARQAGDETAVDEVC
jgi:hypothetical protein